MEKRTFKARQETTEIAQSSGEWDDKMNGVVGVRINLTVMQRHERLLELEPVLGS